MGRIHHREGGSDITKEQLVQALRYCSTVGMCDDCWRQAAMADSVSELVLSAQKAGTMVEDRKIFL